jgi:hypothetical protein
MAEFVEYRAEGMIPELEQLEHIRLFEKHEIRYGYIHIYSQSIQMELFHKLPLFAATFQRLRNSWFS